MKTDKEFKASFGYEMPTSLEELDKLEKTIYYWNMHMACYGGSLEEDRRLIGLEEYLDTVLKPSLTQDTNKKLKL